MNLGGDKMFDLLALLLIEAGIHIGMESVVDRVPVLRKFCRSNTQQEISDIIQQNVEKTLKDAGCIDFVGQKQR